jgi:uncharacterized membrane protein YfcA
MDLALAMLVCMVGGLIAGLIGVGGGIVFVPAMTVLLSKGQVEAESTSLLMIALVSIIGTWRQRSYGNVNSKDALMIGALSPVGVLVGVLLANTLPERALRIGFAMLALYTAYRLLKRVFAADHPDPHVPEVAAPPDTGGSS